MSRMCLKRFRGGENGEGSYIFAAERHKCGVKTIAGVLLAAALFLKCALFIAL